MGLTSRALRRPASAARTERLQKRQLEKSVTWTGRERLRLAWYRMRLEAQDMNYASKRLIELQTQLPDDWGEPLVRSLRQPNSPDRSAPRSQRASGGA